MHKKNRDAVGTGLSYRHTTFSLSLKAAYLGSCNVDSPELVLLDYSNSLIIQGSLSTIYFFSDRLERDPLIGPVSSS